MIFFKQPHPYWWIFHHVWWIYPKWWIQSRRQFRPTLWICISFSDRLWFCGIAHNLVKLFFPYQIILAYTRGRQEVYKVPLRVMCKCTRVWKWYLSVLGGWYYKIWVDLYMILLIGEIDQDSLWIILLSS